MTLTTRSALNVHEPYISHEIADSPFTRASFITEALVSWNDDYIRLLIRFRMNKPGFSSLYYRTKQG